MAEATIFEVSGSSGIALASVICGLYVRKKQYTQCIEKKEDVCWSRLLFYGALAISICQILVYAVTTLVFSQIIPIAENSQTSVENTFARTLFAIFIAPIFEELLFRMSLFSLMYRKFGKVSSIIGCTLIFAVMHGYSIQGILVCSAAGLMFIAIYIQTGNIWYSIIIHMICNLETTIINWLEAKGVMWMGIPIQYKVNGYNTLHPILIAIALVVCILCIAGKKQKEG